MIQYRLCNSSILRTESDGLNFLDLENINKQIFIENMLNKVFVYCKTNNLCVC